MATATMSEVYNALLSSLKYFPSSLTTDLHWSVNFTTEIRLEWSLWPYDYLTT